MIIGDDYFKDNEIKSMLWFEEKNKNRSVIFLCDGKEVWEQIKKDEHLRIAAELDERMARKPLPPDTKEAR